MEPVFEGFVALWCNGVEWCEELSVVGFEPSHGSATARVKVSIGLPTTEILTTGPETPFHHNFTFITYFREAYNHRKSVKGFLFQMHNKIDKIGLMHKEGIFFIIHYL